MKKVFFSIVLCTSFLFSQSQNNWELMKNEDDIKVYTRSTKLSAIKEFKAITYIQTTLDALVEKITDGDGLKKWNYKTTKSSLLEQHSENEYIIYMYNNFPWPVKNRDHISKLSVSKLNETSVKITISSLSKKLPEYKNTIRIEEFSGFWLLEETTKGIKVTQQMHGDPKGYIPSVIINKTLAKAPLYSFKKLKKQFIRQD